MRASPCAVPKSGKRGARPSHAAASAARASASTPSFRAAHTGSTGTSSARESARQSTRPPAARTSSIRFIATTTGSPVSSNCSVKYRPRAGQVASTTLTIASGGFSRRNSPQTASSREKAVSE